MAFRVTVLSAVALGVIAAFPAVGASAGTHASAGASGAGCLMVQTLTFSKAQDAATLEHWTPARISASHDFSQAALGKLGRSRRAPEGAAPISAVRCVPRAAASKGVAAFAPRGAAASNALRGRPATTSSDGYPTVGKLTYEADGVLSLNCTATVLQGTAATNNEDLIVTAAHCIEGVAAGVPYTSTDLAFTPMWHNNEAPYGTWTVNKVFLYSWMNCPIPIIHCTTNPENDYAVIVLNSRNGKGVGDVTGADGWSVNNPGTIDNVTIAGIPGSSPDTLTTVTNTTTVSESGDLYRTATTPGFTAGTSGGPWFEDFRTATDLGTLIGDTGGYEEGGPSSGSPSYSDHWTGNFATLVGQAVSYEG
jgi:V8-like Glu-specific endopeptidase